MPRATKLSSGKDRLIEKVSVQQMVEDAFMKVMKAQLAQNGGTVRFESAKSPKTFQPGLKLKVRLGVTVIGVAEHLGVSRQRVYQLIKEQKLEAFELMDDLRGSAGIFVRTESLDAYLKARGLEGIGQKRLKGELRDPVIPLMRIAEPSDAEPAPKKKAKAK